MPTQIPVDHIEVSPHRIRTVCEPDRLEDLKQSIKEHGIIQPIVIAAHNATYRLVAGLRRLIAASQLQHKTVPCVITRGNGLQLIFSEYAENAHRENFRPSDEAAFFASAIATHKITQKQLASHVARSEQYVGQRLSILSWPNLLREALDNAELTWSACRELANIRDADARLEYIHSAIQYGANDRTCRSFRMQANSATQRDPGEAPAGDIEIPPAAGTRHFTVCNACATETPTTSMRTLFICSDCHQQIINPDLTQVETPATIKSNNESSSQP